MKPDAQNTAELEAYKQATANRLTSEEIARQKRDHDDQIFVSREGEQ